MTIIEYSIDGRFVGNDKTTRSLTDEDVRKVVRKARQEFAPSKIKVSIKHE